jgi:hypothetical protein
MTVGISLGWNCYTTTRGTSLGLRSTKKDGYNTCPFDLMVCNYPGVIQCLYDNFKDFTNPEWFALVPDATSNNEPTIVNKKYNFVHNHESPSIIHSPYKMYIHTEEDKNFYISNNFEKLIEQLNRRVQNFRHYIASGEHINFLITDFDHNLTELHTCIQTMYPTLNYTITRFDLEFNNIENFNRHMRDINVTRLCPEPPKFSILSSIKRVYKT